MAEHKQSPRANDFSWRREFERLTDDWPWAARALSSVAGGQRRALIELRQQLDAVAAEAAREREPDLPELLRIKLDQAAEANAESGCEVLYRRTLSALVPDQVRMLVRLVDRGRAPLAHIAVARWPLGRGRWRVLENATPLARDAGVAVVSYGSVYVRQLRALGLVDEAPVEAGLEEGFERLRSETDVRDALEAIRATPHQYARFERRCLVPTEFANALIAACAGWQETDPAPVGDF